MFAKLTRKKLDSFLKAHATDARVLDIGAGGSGYGAYFPNRVTLDIDPARKPDIVGDAEQLPFPDGSFEYLLCTEVLEHIRDPRRAIAEMRRVLAPGGTLILTTRFVYPIHDAPGDYWRFTKYGLRMLFAEGWKVMELVPEAGTFATMAILFQRIAYQTRLVANPLAKLKLFVLAWFFNHLGWLIRVEYGDIRKSAPETDILASGYYLVAQKL